MAVVLGLVALAVMAQRHTDSRLRTANKTSMVTSVKSDSLVLVRMSHLDDLCELARVAAERLDVVGDPLPMAIRGAIAQVRADAIPEP